MQHYLPQLPIPLYGRKKFIRTSLKAMTGLSFLSYAIPSAGKSAATYTVADVINLILKEVPNAPFRETVDTLKSGRMDQPVAGVVTTMFATLDVIKKAIQLKANFIIAHEPTFYNHTDDTQWVPGNDIVRQKQELLDKHKIAVWRFHDYCHSLHPDAISYGVARKANWLSYYKSGKNLLTIPAVSLQKLVEHLKTSLQISHLRVIGNPSQTCEHIALLPGAWGGQRQIATAEEQQPDVLIVGEVHEWETAEYIRDARALGRKTALIVVGHLVSEQPGMEWIKDWLTPKLAGIPVTYLAETDPFTWM